jgi:hypothetical protein
VVLMSQWSRLSENRRFGATRAPICETPSEPYRNLVPVDGLPLVPADDLGVVAGWQDGPGDPGGR